MEDQNRLTQALADRYRIEREIGSGGMATVYLAEDLKHDRQVAVKVLDPDLAQTLGAERFLREIKTAAHLTHPHILPVFDSGEADGFLFYVMPFVEGESLRSRLTKERQLPVEDAIQIAREIADALDYAHRKGVIHRDVKPANIMLEEGHAVLADFGVAHAVAEAKEERLTRTGTSLGTPAYMSPEQASGERDLDGRSDQYALGCVLYEMLAGQPPFTGAQVEAVVRQHLTADPPDVTHFRPTVPTWVTEPLAKALAKAPADRFQTTGDLRTVLGAELQTPPGGIPATARPSPRSTFVMKLVAAVGATAALLVAWQAWIGDESEVATVGPPAWTILAEVEGTAPEGLRDAVRSLLSGEIDASGVAEVVSDDAILRGLASAMMSDTTRLTLRVARELAERVQIGTVFAPRLDVMGDTYVLTLQVLHGEGDGVLDTKRVTASDQDGLIGASRAVVDSLRPAVAAWVGEGVRPPLENPPITSSMAALRKLNEASSGLTGAFSARTALYREALDLDPEFAEAWRRLGYTFWNAGFRDSALIARREALKHPDRLSERQRLLLRTMVEGDAVGRFRLLEAEYRRTGRVTIEYATALADVMGRYEEAVDRFSDMAEQSPFGISPNSHFNWTHYLLALGRVEEAKTAAAGLDGTVRELPLRTTIAIREGSWDEAEHAGTQITADPSRDPRWRSLALQVIASSRAARGSLDEAVDAIGQAIRTEESSGRVEGLRLARLRLLLLTVAAGLEPGTDYLTGLRADTTEYGQVVTGLWAAEVGDTVLARSSLGALPVQESSEYGLPSVFESLVAALQGRLAALGGHWDEAVGVLEPVTGHRAPRHMISTRLPNWIRAEAEEELGRLAEAAELYSQIATGYRFGDYEVPAYGLTYSFAHRRAALLYGQLGQEDEAIQHWQAFLEAFTEPDPEFEGMVEEAQAELARLEG